MKELKLIIVIILFILIVLMTFYICSNINKKKPAATVLLLIVTVIAATFMTIQKDSYIQLNNGKVKILNVSYYCPECKTYIPNLETKYCSHCGINLRYIKNRITGN